MIFLAILSLLCIFLAVILQFTTSVPAWASWLLLAIAFLCVWWGEFGGVIHAA